MSLLHNVLSKLNRPPESGDVHPDLRQIIAHDDRRGEGRKKYLRFGVVAVSAVTIGLVLALSVDKLSKPVSKKLQVTSATVTRPPAPVPALNPTPVPAPTRISPPTPAPGPALKSPVLQKIQAFVPAALRKTSTDTIVKKKVVSAGPTPSLKVAQDTRISAVVSPKTSVNSNENMVPASRPQTTDKDARDTYLIAARSAEKKKEFGEALRQYQKALGHDQENPNLMNNVAGLYIRLGDYPAALDMVGKALNRVPDFIPALINQGIARSSLGNSSDARDSFAKALELNPSNKTAMYNLALFNEKNGKLGEASAMFQRLGKYGDAQGLLGVARIYEKQSRKSDAVKVYIEVASMKDIPTAARNTAVERLRQLAN